MLMTEGALGWSIGPPELMEAQMEHLAAATRRRNARVGIVAFGAWSPNIPLPLHGWKLYDERFVIAGTITSIGKCAAASLMACCGCGWSPRTGTVSRGEPG